MIAEPLAALKSVAGVEGAFVFNNKGSLIGRDISGLYTADLVKGLQQQSLHFFESVDEYLGAHDEFLLRFQERVLYVRRSKDLLVFVIALPDCAIDSLRMGSNLLLGQTHRILAEPQPVRPVMRPPEVIPVRTNHVAPGYFGNSQPSTLERINPLNPASRPAMNQPPRGPKPKSEGIWG